MSNSAYVLAYEPRSGKSLVVLGMMEILSRRVERLAYFRPLVSGDPADNAHIQLVRDRYRIKATPEQMVGMRLDRAQQLIADGQKDILFGELLNRYHALARDAEFILCEGTDYSGLGASFEFEFNAGLAIHLRCPIVLVGSAAGRSVAETMRTLRTARASLEQLGDTVAATFVNRASAAQAEEIRAELDLHPETDGPSWVLPETPALARPTVAQVAAAVGAEWLHDPGDAAQRDIATYRVAAMQLPNALSRTAEGSLIITPGDRADILVGAIASVISEGFATPAAVLLTGGLEPPPAVMRLLDGMRRWLPPILLVEGDTFTAAMGVEGTQAVLTADNTPKIAAALGAFESSVDIEALLKRVAVARSERVTPLMFENDLIEKARRDRKTIVLPEGSDDRVLRAAAVLARREVASLVLLGKPEEIATRAATLGVDLLTTKIIDPVSSPDRQHYAEVFYEARKHKGVTLQDALDQVEDVNCFGTIMVHLGDADGMVSGAAHTTAQTIRPALQIIRTAKGVSVVSSVFLMCLPDRVLVYGDCAVNPDPTPAELADIAIGSAATAAQFGVPPRVAMLSYSTGDSGSGAAVEKVREATRIARERAPNLSIEGPMQYDAAIDPSVAASKLPGSSVAGKATVFIFPDLDSGNNTYKAVQRSASAVAIGPVLQGLRKPVNDLSRGCTVADIVNTVAITAIQAQAGAGAAE
ncbi:Phosphate acetyltransferase [Posidoniimonas polymericola]|uniref:Phosphate acetyltransferase n=1 Tax=Posidoniimonas polymericola TaxID=2528002 RepID=A0A5C5YLD1_9BACT|nr:phosphate acetyltransferase [Posidoniimonas polymericola]TWT75647.1 Phosphate acetyltransferase [Posidoniimonas polymericola]